MAESATDLLVKRDDLRSRRFAETPLPHLTEGEALLRVDRFALTANTVTYAAMGEALRYWSFFPSAEAGWGRVPCWGFAEVIESKASGVDQGARYYGYYPIGTHLVVQPARVRAEGFADGAAHRQPLPPVYNSYARAENQSADAEAMTMLFRPLFTTSWLIDEFLADAKFFGAKRVALSSASGKTAAGLAWSLKRRGGAEVVGFTSPNNAAFVEGTRCYDRVVKYDDVSSLDATLPIVYVDFSGAAALRRALHMHFRDALVYDCAVGASDWSAATPPGGDPLPGAAPEFFFAPTQIEKVVAAEGRPAFETRLSAAFAAFNASARHWMNIVRAEGEEAVNRYWGEAVEGRIPAADGVILRL